MARLTIGWKSLIFLNFSRSRIKVPHRPTYKFCWTKKKYHIFRRHLSTEDTDIYEAAIEMPENYQLDTWLQNVLKIDFSSDPISNSLAYCGSVQEVFNILAEKKNELSTSNISHALLALGFLHGLYLKIKIDSGLDVKNVEDEFVTTLKNFEDYKNLLKMVEENLNRFSVDELSGCLLYLSKFDLDLKSELMQKLIYRMENEVEINSVSLRALSRFAVALKHSVYELWVSFILLKLLSNLNQRIGLIDNLEDFHLATICLTHLHQLLNHEKLKNFTSLCERLFVENKIVPKDVLECHFILKAASFLCFPHWSTLNTKEFCQLSNLLRGRIGSFSRKDLIALHKAFQTQLEPAAIIDELYETALSSLRANNQENSSSDIGLFSVVAQLSPHSKRKQIEEIFINELPVWDFSSSYGQMFQILRSIKSSNVQLCDQFWSRLTETLHTNKELRQDFKLFRIATKYMYFNNNLGGTYRHHTFERFMIQLILNELENGMSSFTPHKYAKGSAFVLAYSYDSQVINKIIKKLLTIGKQLTKVDCMAISRGLEIMLELSKRGQINSGVVENLVELNTMLNECAERHVVEDDDLISLTVLLKTYYSRRGSKESPLFDTFINRLENAEGEWNSRVIRDLSHSFLGFNYLSPVLMNKMADYVVANEKNVTADTAERVLTCCYNLAYLPKVGEQFLNACSELILRDLERLSGLAIIQACLALSYFQAFPADLVEEIFSVGFLDRIDSEIAFCYSRASYPLRVRYTLMELNRSVCIDMPQLAVPWFHEKYSKEVAALDYSPGSSLENSVAEALLSLTSNFQRNVYSPYGYKINFLLNLDRRTIPLSKYADAKDICKRVAVLIHSKAHFTSGKKRLKGACQLRQRHLEMLGYTVVTIDEHKWHALYLSEAHAKKDYLSNCIWPER